jgi:hypothetical protein
MRGGMRPAQPHPSASCVRARGHTAQCSLALKPKRPHTGQQASPAQWLVPQRPSLQGSPDPTYHMIPAASPPRSAQPGSTQADPARLGPALREQWSRFPTTPFLFSLSSHVLPGKRAAGISVHRRGAALGMPHCSPLLRHGRPGSGAVRVGFRTRGQAAGGNARLCEGDFGDMREEVSCLY